MLTSLRLLQQTISKRQRALNETLDLNDYIQEEGRVEPYPFPHLVVDNFFKPEVYDRLWRHFTSVLERGFATENDQTRFHPFLNLKGKYEYDGYVYVPRPDEESILNIFFSLKWNLFFSKLFNQPTGWCTSLAYHYHPEGNRTGFVHHDCVPCTFSSSDRLASGIIYREERKDAPATDIQQTRTIAIVYYLGDHLWQEGEGGETGIYLSENEPPFKRIAPYNNRLFAFQISPKSFHAFQKNLAPRASIAQWFHVNP